MFVIRVWNKDFLVVSKYVFCIKIQIRIPLWELNSPEPSVPREERFWIWKFWKFWNLFMLKLIVFFCFFEKTYWFWLGFFRKIAKTIGFGSFLKENFQNFQNFGVRILEIFEIFLKKTAKTSCFGNFWKKT